MDLFKDDVLTIDVGNRLRQLRLERGKSMRALARTSGLSTNALSMIERSKTSPSVSTLYKIAEALEVPITAFFRLRFRRRRAGLLHGIPVLCRRLPTALIPMARFYRGWLNLSSRI